jgi:hypothetical protein
MSTATQDPQVVTAPGAVTPKTSRPHAAALVTLAVIVAAGVLLVALASTLWFMPDDWAFLLHRRVTFLGDRSLLEPHNGHWSLLPILVFRFLFTVVGMHSYLPYVAVTIGLHLAICVVLWRVLRSVGASPWVCCLTLVPAAFIGPGIEDVLWDFQMGFLAPSLLALVGLLVIERTETLPRRPVRLWVLGTLALMCSGSGVIAVVWVAAYALLRRGWRAAATVASVPAVVYVHWYAAYGRGTGIAPPVPPELVMPYMLRGMTNTWDQMLQVPWSGSVVLVVLVASTVVRSPHRRLRLLAGAGLIAWAANWFLLALSRGGFGAVSALQTRYLYTSVLLTLPAVALTLQLLWDVLHRHGRLRSAVWLAMGLVLLVVGASSVRQMAETKRDQIGALKEQVVAGAQLMQRGDHVLAQQLSPGYAPDIDAASLARPSVQRRLPDIRPSARGRIEAAATLEVGVGARSFGLPSAPDVHALTGLTETARGSGCWDLRAGAGAQLLLPRSTGSQVVLTVLQGQILTQLVDGDLRSARAVHEVTAGEKLYVGSTAEVGDLVITLPAGSATLCGAGSLTRGE